MFKILPKAPIYAVKKGYVIKIIGVLFIMLVNALASFGQEIKINGKVFASNATPLTGVSVVEVGSNKTTVTDQEGKFSLLVSKPSASITFSYIGYESETINIEDANKTLKIFLKESAYSLDGVRVRGFSDVYSNARRRSQSLQKIPETVSIITGQDMANAGINDLRGVSNTMSNVFFTQSQNPGINFLTVRGIPQIRNAESPVAVLINGVYQPDANVLGQELFDLESVELIKGPQGTLYGKNAIGGALNITTTATTNYFRNFAKVSGGNGGYFNGMAGFSGPIVKSKLFYKFSGNYKNFNGLINNTYLNKKVDNVTDINLKGELKYDVDKKLAFTAGSYYFKTSGGAIYWVTSDKPGVSTLTSNDYSVSSPISDVLGSGHVENSFNFAKIEYDLKDVKLQSVLSYNQVHRYHTGDLDMISIPLAKQEQNVRNKNSYIEIKGVGTINSKFTWTLGAIGLVRSHKSETYVPHNFAGTTDYSGKIIAENSLIRTNTLAGYGFAEYKLNKFTFSAGGRVDYDKIEQTDLSADPSIAVRSKSITKFQPKASISYAIGSTALAYVNYGVGYRNGSFNTPTPNSYFTHDYLPEFTDNYEFGLKTSAFNNRLIFNLSAFYIDFKNMQIYVLEASKGLQGIVNIDKSRIKGLEAEVKYRIIKSLDFYANWGLSESKMLKSNNPAYAPYMGNRIPWVNGSSFSLGLQPHFQLSSNSSFLGNISLDQKGKLYWFADNKDAQNPYSLLNARMAYRVKRFEVGLWSKNITNTKYNTEFVDKVFGGTLSVTGNLRWPNQPRTFGLDLSVTF